MSKRIMMTDDLNVGQWNVYGFRDNNRCRVVKHWVSGLHTPLHELYL